VKPKWLEEVGDGGKAQPGEGAVEEASGLGEGLLHARRAPHLEREHVLAVPHAEEGPGGGWVREKAG